MHFAPLGDQAIMITIGDSINESARRRVRAISNRLAARAPAGVVDVVPAFISIAVHYDPGATPLAADGSAYHSMVDALRDVLADVTEEELPPARIVDIPVCYGGDLGPDLESLASLHGLSTDEVVRIHADGDYLVYMVGFMPGFAYLGGLSARIATPRRSSPRTAVPAGAVGIGGQQTGIYPLESPGGWHLIGRTPARIFDIARPEPTLLASGDRVRFSPISLAEFHEQAAAP